MIDDPEVSRTHLEIRLDIGSDQAFLIDISSNGTKLNGLRLQRAVLVPIKSGDEIRIGDLVAIFRSQRFTTVKRVRPKTTRGRIERTAVVMVSATLCLV